MRIRERPVKPSQQKLRSLKITALKNLIDVELDFTQASLTALMGANCSGKTTVLHALACAFSPPDNHAPNYKFPQFFKPNSDSLWKGSDFTVEYSHRLGPKTLESLSQRYTKTQDRWTPRYDKRPTRYTRFLMIRDSVPEVETINLNAMIHYDRTIRVDQSDQKVREAAGQILNRSYDQYHHVVYRYGKRKSIGVSIGALTYPALSMSSGEQRVFHILDAVINAPDYALILIDEIDLFLHQDALQRLLLMLSVHCNERKKQLIFTTHFPPIAKMYDQMAVLTIHRSPTKTLAWHGYSHAALRHITGAQEKPISVFTEDDVAEAIIGQVVRELRLRPFTTIGHFGPAINAFKLGAGIVLSGQDIKNSLIVLDGDVLSTRIERMQQSQKECTGNGPVHEEQRKRLIALVRPLWPVSKKSPEQMLHAFLHKLNRDEFEDDDSDLLEIAQSVVNVPDRHGLIGKIVEDSGESREVALTKIVKLASKADGWKRYTRLIRCWLIKKRAELNLDQHH